MFKRFRQSQTQKEREISAKAITACEHIMRDMGAEIHDDLLQMLSVLRIGLGRLERAQIDDPTIVEIIQRMQLDFDIVTTSVRKLSHRLMPVSIEDETFQELILGLCETMEIPGTNHIHFRSRGAERPLESATRNHLYRMVQELMHNALRHSTAWHIWVRLIWQEQSLLIEVEDDGTAFSKIQQITKELNKKHNSLRMRSEVVGATLHFKAGERGLIATICYLLPPTS
ncbi:MAG: sensor histidine kinase [Cyclobacteriaceae bacterium]